MTPDTTQSQSFITRSKDPSSSSSGPDPRRRSRAALPEPYSRPYATWDARPAADLRLTDVEIRELVLLRGMSDYCQATPDQVVTLRAAGQTPKAIVAEHPPRQRGGATAPVQENSAPPGTDARPPGDER